MAKLVQPENFARFPSVHLACLFDRLKNLSYTGGGGIPHFLLVDMIGLDIDIFGHI